MYRSMYQQSSTNLHFCQVDLPISAPHLLSHRFYRTTSNGAHSQIKSMAGIINHALNLRIYLLKPALIRTSKKTHHHVINSNSWLLVILTEKN